MADDTTLTDPSDIQKTMDANSAAYNQTNDPVQQAAYHQQNMALGTSIGGTYDQNTGHWTFPTKLSAPTQMNSTTIPLPRGYMPESGGYQTTDYSTEQATNTAGKSLTPDGVNTLSSNGEQIKANSYSGHTYAPIQELTKMLGTDYSVDNKTGVLTVNGKNITPMGYDQYGNPMVSVRDVAGAKGYTQDQIQFDPKTRNITITGELPNNPNTSNSTTPGTSAPPAVGQPPVQPSVQPIAQPVQQPIYTSPVQSIAQGMPQQPQMTPWTPPDVSGFQHNMMPYQQFNPNWNQYYQQAHNQLDPQFNANNQHLMDLQNQQITKSDESMNRRGIYNSGIAQAAENDLRAKTTNTIAQGFTAQMAQIEKVAQNLYQNAFKESQQGNQFALKNNQDQIMNMLNTEKQSFSQWAQTQRLDQSQYSYALKAWDQMAGMIMKDAQNQMTAQKSMLPYEMQTANNAANNATSAANTAANNQTKTNIALLPYQSMTQYQQATTQEKAAMDAAINYFKQQGININEGKLMESITHDRNTEGLTASGQAITQAHNTATQTENALHDRATEANAAANIQMNAYKLAGYLPNGQPTFDREKFDQTIKHDKDLVDIARTNATNAENKTEIEGIGKELTSISGQINSIYNNPTTDAKQQAANMAMVTSLSGQRDQYINQLKQYTDKGFYTPPSQ